MGEIQNQENILLIFQKIIEQESKTSTYKFALLRAVIDIITAQSPHIEERATHVAIPVQLVSDKWLFYYWDLIAESYSQIHSGRTLAFEEQLREIQKNHSIQNYWDFKQEFQKPNYSEELELQLSEIQQLQSQLHHLEVTLDRRVLGLSMMRVLSDWQKSQN